MDKILDKIVIDSAGVQMRLEAGAIRYDNYAFSLNGFY